jgi:hypothetical protein
VYRDRVAGAEFPPITSTLGTFGGVAVGVMPGAWRVQISHQPLRAAGSVAITAGTFSMQTLSHGTLNATVTGGSVSVVDNGGGCRNQRFAVRAELSDGTFIGTLTHHRRSILGRCVIYAAMITGRATLQA